MSIALSVKMQAKPALPQIQGGWSWTITAAAELVDAPASAEQSEEHHPAPTLIFFFIKTKKEPGD
jgi:hypothetical protein